MAVLDLQQPGGRGAKPQAEPAPLHPDTTALKPGQPRLGLGLLHQDMVEEQHQAMPDLIDHP